MLPPGVIKHALIEQTRRGRVACPLCRIGGMEQSNSVANPDHDESCLNIEHGNGHTNCKSINTLDGKGG